MTLGVLVAVSSMLVAITMAAYGTGRRWSLTPLFLFVATSILFINVGFLVFYIREPDWWSTRALLATSIGLLAVGSGGFIATATLNARTRWVQSSVPHGAQGLPYGTAVQTSVVVFGIVLLYFVLLGYVPLIEGLSTLFREGFVPGLVNTARTGRDVYVNPDARYIPMQGLMEAFRYFALPAVAVWFVHYRRERINPRLSTFFALASVALIVSTGQRWPLMFLLVSVGVYLSWAASSGQHLRRLAIRVGALALGMGILLSALLGRTLETDLTFGQMLLMGAGDLYGRVFFGNVSVPFESYAIYGVTHDWLWGASWIQNLQTYLPGPAPSFPVTFMLTVRGGAVGYTAPPDFYTEAYINFGFPGVVVASLVWGAFLVYCQRFLIQARRSVRSMGLAAMLTTVAAFASISGVALLLSGAIVGTITIGIASVPQLLKRARVAHGRSPTSGRSQDTPHRQNPS